MIFNDMGWRPDMIWYITALVALLARIDGEPIYEDLYSLFRPCIADVEIMVYLGILDTRKFLGSQKILTKITAILSRK